MSKLKPANQSTQALRSKPTLTIHLEAIQDNYQHLAKMVAPAECAAVVKANAYGLGVAEIAPALWTAGARRFFVATVDEGLELRQILPDAVIYILNGLMDGDQELCLNHHLIPIINTFESFELWRSVGKLSKKELPLVLHIDTGLNRLGLSEEEYWGLLAQDMTGLRLDMVISHLACADTPDHPITQQQKERFEALTKDLPTEVVRSLSASDGIFRGSDLHYDLVRPGAALYGLNPTLEQENPMNAVLQLNVPVLQIREVTEDGIAGYAATAKVKKGQRLAILAYGYADGLMRSASNKGSLYHKGQALPIVGRVSMDITIIDISSLPENALKQGDILQVFGANQSPDDLAKAMGTIGYEVITSLGQRFRRQYL